MLKAAPRQQIVKRLNRLDPGPFAARAARIRVTSHLDGTLRSRAALAWQIFGPLVGEFSGEQLGGLAEFDQVAVGVLHVAADLGTAIDRRRDELGPL